MMHRSRIKEMKNEVLYMSFDLSDLIVPKKCNTFVIIFYNVDKI